MPNLGQKNNPIGRFDRPGRHKIRARFMYPYNEEGVKIGYTQEFEFEVGAR